MEWDIAENVEILANYAEEKLLDLEDEALGGLKAGTEAYESQVVRLNAALADIQKFIRMWVEPGSRPVEADDETPISNTEAAYKLYIDKMVRLGIASLKSRAASPEESKAVEEVEAEPEQPPAEKVDVPALLKAAPSYEAALEIAQTHTSVEKGGNPTYWANMVKVARGAETAAIPTEKPPWSRITQPSKWKEEAQQLVDTGRALMSEYKVTVERQEEILKNLLNTLEFFGLKYSLWLLHDRISSMDIGEEKGAGGRFYHGYSPWKSRAERGTIWNWADRKKTWVESLFTDGSPMATAQTETTRAGEPMTREQFYEKFGTFADVDEMWEAYKKEKGLA